MLEFKDRGFFFRIDFYGRKSDVSLVESSSRKRVGLRGIVGSTRLMAWVVRERGGGGSNLSGSDEILTHLHHTQQSTHSQPKPIQT